MWWKWEIYMVNFSDYTRKWVKSGFVVLEIGRNNRNIIEIPYPSFSVNDRLQVVA